MIFTYFEINYFPYLAISKIQILIKIEFIIQTHKNHLGTDHFDHGKKLSG